MFDPEVLQSGFGVNFSFWSANFRKIAGEFLREFLQGIFSVNFSALCLQGFRPSQKNSRPEFTPKNRPTLLSNFTYSNPKSFLLRRF